MPGTFITLPLTGASPYWGNSVSTAASLPTTGDVTGEVLLVLDTAALYFWDGAAWQVLVDGLADVSGPASSTDNALALFNGTTGKVIKAASAITASRALASDASGVPVAATTTATELGYVNGVTSAIQTQLNGKEPTITVLTVAKGGTNSGAALTNSKVMVSTAGAVVESTITTTELGYLDNVTSDIQTQFSGKVTGPASATDTAVAVYDGTTGKLVKDTSIVRVSSTSLRVGAQAADGPPLSVDGNVNDSTIFDLLQRNANGYGVYWQINSSSSTRYAFDLVVSTSVHAFYVTNDARIGIGTNSPAASAALDITSTTGALIMPRMTTTQRNNLTGVNGMCIYNTTTDRFQGYFAGAWGDLHGWGS